MLIKNIGFLNFIDLTYLLGEKRKLYINLINAGKQALKAAVYQMRSRVENFFIIIKGNHLEKRDMERMKR